MTYNPVFEWATNGVGVSYNTILTDAYQNERVESAFIGYALFHGYTVMHRARRVREDWFRDGVCRDAFTLFKGLPLIHTAHTWWSYVMMHGDYEGSMHLLAFQSHYDAVESWCVESIEMAGKEAKEEWGDVLWQAEQLAVLMGVYANIRQRADMLAQSLNHLHSSASPQWWTI